MPDRACLYCGTRNRRHTPGCVANKRRVCIPLSEGELHVSLSPDASPETIEALKQIGEATVKRMREDGRDG